MRKGYQNLLETLTLLTMEKNRAGIDHIEIMTANDTFIHRFAPDAIIVTASEIFGRSNRRWVQIPLDELTSVGVEFKAESSQTLPVALEEARARRTKVPIADVA